MRLRAVTRGLALPSLAFAPAPFPRAQRPQTPTQKRERLLGVCRRRLDELGVRWRLAEDRDGRKCLRFGVRHEWH